YHAAKESQGLMEARIAKLKDKLANARLVDESQMDNSRVFILSTAKIKNVKNGFEISYTLVAENEADLKLKKISIDSPIAKGLLGKEVGDIVQISTPGGAVDFEILEISR
ncbi:MAG: transcription elongation factor GreA, partial [Flavobacteriales bacterium]|nr:transcription elongation factor GreA [Flavobacteriales bacterium]